MADGQAAVAGQLPMLLGALYERVTDEDQRRRVLGGMRVSRWWLIACERLDLPCLLVRCWTHRLEEPLGVGSRVLVGGIEAAAPVGQSALTGWGEPGSRETGPEPGAPPSRKGPGDVVRGLVCRASARLQPGSTIVPGLMVFPRSGDGADPRCGAARIPWRANAREEWTREDDTTGCGADGPSVTDRARVRRPVGPGLG